jgi:glycosyltransferase involved in cell wall biosynthesis
LVAFPLAARKAGAAAVHVQYNLSPLVRRGGVTTIHDVSFFIGPQWFGLKDRMLLRRFVPASVQRSARVIAVSETCRQEIERFIPTARGKTAVTPEAAAPWIKPMERRAAKARVRQLVGLEEPYLFTLGTSWARKNQALATEVVERIAPGPRLYIGGKAAAAEPVTPRVHRLGYVAQADLSALYSGAEAHILPSLHEGFGLTLLEAFACGCPVLCGNGGALPEVAGGAATIVPSYDPQAWADALQGMLSSNLDELRERGRRRAAEFSWAATARLTRQVYEGVVNP